MKTTRAVVAGLLGALAMSASMLVMRLLGLDVNLEALLGSMAGPYVSFSPWLAGFVLHLTIGCVVGVLYAAGFELAIQHSGPFVGAGFGLSHALLAGLFMSSIPAMNPLVMETRSAPGAFLSNVQYGPLLFFALHLLYGAVVGSVYGATLQKPHAYSNRAA